MWNALTSLGGGGARNIVVASNANIALYTSFAIFGCLSGAIHNLVGPRTCAAVGALPFGFYTLSMWYASTSEDFIVHAMCVLCGALVGMGASVLWTAQGVIVMSYPTQERKGMFIGIFWAIFNMGPVLGSLLATIINWNNSDAKASNATYLVFIVVMFSGVFIALLLAPPDRLIRHDGTLVVLESKMSAKLEFNGILATFKDTKMLLLMPACLASNWFYTVHFNGLNLQNFTFRTRSFNSIFYWTSQIIGAVLFGKLLDFQRTTRKKRASIALGVLTCVTIASWSGFFVLLIEYYNDGFSRQLARIPAWDLVSTSSWSGPFTLFCTFGLLDAAFQSFAYWLMSCTSNDPSTLARYAGFYKGIQSIGAAIAWAADGTWELEYMLQALLAFIVMLASLPLMYILSRTLEEPVINSEMIKKQLESTNTNTMYQHFY